MKTALIVGASRGIGREFARQYKRAGWRVLATARDDDALEALANLGAETFPLDITEPEEIAALGWKLDGEPLHAAVLVAGVYGPRTEGVDWITSEDFADVMNTNVRGPMQLIPILLPLVEGARGVLAVLSSKMGSISEATGTTGWLYRASNQDRLAADAQRRVHRAASGLGAHGHGRPPGRYRSRAQRRRHARCAGAGCRCSRGVQRPLLSIRRYATRVVRRQTNHGA